MIINVLAATAPTEEKRKQAIKDSIIRNETLNIMYNNIIGLSFAKLETKNFIYDNLKSVIEKYV